MVGNNSCDLYNISSTQPKIEDEDLSHMQQSEEATVGNIMKHENSAAAIWCQLKRHRNQAAHMKDVLGVVATLGKVNDDNLSGLLSEYLGLDNMLALVCMTYDGLKSLESYDKEGSINKSSGLHGLGASIGQTLEGPFNVICLEHVRPYVGEFMVNDPQRRLALRKPALPNGESPAGFIGFAVNMIQIDSAHLCYLTTDGNGLRETLFYTLFSRLQVYKTRADMMQSLPCISNGAISLDGGMIRSNGVYYLHTRKKEMDVKFAISFYLPETYVGVEKQTELKRKSEKLMDDIQVSHPVAFNTRIDPNYEEEEFVPETQESQTSQSFPTQQLNPVPQPNLTPTQEGKKKKKFENRATRQLWSEDEEVALVSAWVDVSKEGIVDNFWKKTEKVFYSNVGRENYRTHHQMNTKFNDLNKKITRFADIYNNLVNNRSSGMSEGDILQKARYQYREDVGAPFNHEKAWEILKQYPKWNLVPTMSPSTSRASKRSKTLKSSNTNVNRNDDDDDENEDEILQLERPIARNKAKKASSNTIGSNPDESITHLSQINEVNQRVDNTTDYKMKKLELELEKQYEKDFEFYCTPHEHLTGAVLAATLARKEKIRIKYNF